jgi:predicted nucleotidyltransferase component of viral defense system
VITQGQLRLISRHYAGHGERFAFLELAQEHFLLWMVREGLFDIGTEDVVFKGGTAIRKYRLGLRGRFSTDLDFAIADGTYGDHILTSLDRGNIELEGVRFEATGVDLDAAKGNWKAVVEGLGETMEAKIEFSRRPILLPPVRPTERPEIPGFDAALIGFDLPMVPLMRLEENLAEKLARFRRIIRSRDVYDLAALGRDVRDDLALIRQIACFKVYFDVVRDGRESPAPFRAGPEFMGRTENEIYDPGDLGLIMGGRVDYAAMLGTVSAMFGPMGGPQGEVEQTLARLNPKDLWWAEEQYAALRAQYRDGAR